MKLILAIVHKEDKDDTIAKLNQSGYFVTHLSTTGGFLKTKNSTLMICAEDHQIEKALSIIKECAGQRKTTMYSTPTIAEGNQCAGVNDMPIPIQVDVGGSTIFVVDVEQFQKV